MRTGPYGRHRHYGLPRSRYATAGRSVSRGRIVGRAVPAAGPVAPGTVGRGPTSGQAQKPLEGQRDQKPFEKSQESRGNDQVGRRPVRARRYE